MYQIITWLGGGEFMEQTQVLSSSDSGFNWLHTVVLCLEPPSLQPMGSIFSGLVGNFTRPTHHYHLTHCWTLPLKHSSDIESTLGGWKDGWMDGWMDGWTDGWREKALLKIHLSKSHQWSLKMVLLAEMLSIFIQSINFNTIRILKSFFPPLGIYI